MRSFAWQREERRAEQPRGDELNGSSIDLKDLQRNFVSTSSCGVCGKASIDAIRVRGLRQLDRDFASILKCCAGAEILRASRQSLTGRRLHAAALFSATAS